MSRCKMMAQAMTETKSTDTDKLIDYLEKDPAIRRAEGPQGLFPLLGPSARCRRPIRSP